MYSLMLTLNTVDLISTDLTADIAPMITNSPEGDLLL